MRVEFGRLVDWVEGRLPEDEARAVEEQVARADSRTLADVAWLRKFVKATDNAVLESPPREVRDALIARFEAYANGQRTPGLLKRVLASLTFESDLRPAVGLRTAGAQQARRQLVYSAGAFDVVLNLRSRVPDENLVLDGQVLPREDQELKPFSVQLLYGGTELGLTATDELGSFALRDIPPGVYDIVLSTDEEEISIAPVDLSA
ncbi:MAG: hypothetical protein K0S10_926 [Rubrobacteraceae bacterium]|jgi:hypothetical protein|nr:hypothetical protein [Rubrobacteraceae bacterium]